MQNMQQFKQDISDHYKNVIEKLITDCFAQSKTVSETNEFSSEKYAFESTLEDGLIHLVCYQCITEEIKELHNDIVEGNFSTLLNLLHNNTSFPAEQFILKSLKKAGEHSRSLYINFSNISDHLKTCNENEINQIKNTLNRNNIAIFITPNIESSSESWRNFLDSLLLIKGFNTIRTPRFHKDYFEKAQYFMKVKEFFNKIQSEFIPNGLENMEFGTGFLRKFSEDKFELIFASLKGIKNLNLSGSSCFCLNPNGYRCLAHYHPDRKSSRFDNQTLLYSHYG